MKDFVAAAAPALKKGVSQKEEDSISFNHEGTPVKFYKPGSAQMGILMMMMGDVRKEEKELSPERIRAIMHFFFGMMDMDTAIYFQARMLNRDDPLCELGAPNGLIDIVDALSKEWQGKASASVPASKTPPRRTGRSSTGTTSVKA